MRAGMLTRLRHPLAAVLAVAGLGVGSVAALSTASSAAEVTAKTTFTCAVTPPGDAPYPAYDYVANVKLTTGRDEGSDTVTVVAQLSKMTGVMPVAISNLPFVVDMGLDVDGAPVKLTGSSKVSAKANQPFDMPALQGTFTSTAESAAVKIQSLDFTMTYTPGFDFTGACTPKSGQDLGTVMLSGAVPSAPATPTPTTTVTPTKTPKPTASPTKKPGAPKGEPAEGAATFACTLSIGSKFDYDADITVSGSRANPGDPVSLVATMSKLPGIAPVPIDGQMDYTLDVEAAGTKVTLKASDTVSAAPNAEVAVPPLTGEVDAEGDEMEIAVTKFTFDFPSASIGAECTTAKKSLGTMTVGSEPIDTDPPGGGDGGDPNGGVAGGGTLPKTGGADALPVVGLWALALTLLGAAGLLCVPQVARRRTTT